MKKVVYCSCCGKEVSINDASREFVIKYFGEDF